MVESTGKKSDRLREQIVVAEAELQALKAQLAHVEADEEEAASRPQENGHAAWKWPLEAGEYERYGRQLILPSVGINGQKRLKTSRVLVVGAGGLGCPAAAYLAGAGVGTLGVVDGDVVEVSNLHRQIAHGTSRVGQWKVDSLVAYCKELNPLPTYIAHREHLTPENAQAIVSTYDLVLDCTDHPTSRYLISDICVLLQKPLVSASALRTDGQLIVLNTPPVPQGVVHASTDDGTPAPPPCYRCVFPKPPPPDAVVSCGEGGVLGPAVGVMGVLQALEAIKILSAGLHLAPAPSSPPNTHSPAADSSKNEPGTMGAAPPTLLLFSGGPVGAPSFRALKMRSRRRACFACGEGSAARLTLDTLRSGSLDYVAFCGGRAGAAPVRVLGSEQRISAREYSRLHAGPSEAGARRRVLLDVREKELFELGSIPGAVNVPFSRLHRGAAKAGGSAALLECLPPGLGEEEEADVYVVCRVGNDSQLVVKELIDAGVAPRDNERWVRDIKGGMRAWRDEVDETMPFL